MYDNETFTHEVKIGDIIRLVRGSYNDFKTGDTAEIIGGCPFDWKLKILKNNTISDQKWVLDVDRWEIVNEELEAVNLLLTLGYKVEKMVDLNREGWVNIYPYTKDKFASKEDANKNASYDRIACIQYKKSEGI